MKKKGLIVATIVMVLVLAVSLTTATYAWFTATSLVEVDTINFTVATAADLVIGVKSDNKLADEEETTAADYYSGDTVYTIGGTFKDPGTWLGAFNSLGSEINLNGLEFENLSQAVGTGTYTGATPGSYNQETKVYTPGSLGGTADTAWSDTNYATGMIQANGQGASVDEDTIDTAWKNVHYLDVVIGVQATKSNLESMTCYVTINPTAGNAIIGMNAAIHVAYRVVAPGAAVGAFTDQDIYGTTNKYSTQPSAITNTVYNDAKEAYDEAKGVSSTGLTCIGGASGVVLNDGAITFPITIASGGSISITDIYQVQLVIFIAGYDTDCLEGAKGVGSQIIITFAGVEAAE